QKAVRKKEPEGRYYGLLAHSTFPPVLFCELPFVRVPFRFCFVNYIYLYFSPLFDIEHYSIFSRYFFVVDAVMLIILDFYILFY
ncbi:hypothetical protein BUY85_00490, partial [Staphylococcus equorum]|uniref:hypothetical protein n=1 Tax=Staphylococcus equorum TaxID=246432 RepID=UPI000D429376